MVRTTSSLFLYEQVELMRPLDTVYGCQDKKDDIKVGVWSSALFFGIHVWTAAVAFDAAFVACLYFAGVANGQGLPYFVISVAGAAVQLVYQLATMNTEEEGSCWCKYLILARIDHH